MATRLEELLHDIPAVLEQVPGHYMCFFELYKLNKKNLMDEYGSIESLQKTLEIIDNEHYQRIKIGAYFKMSDYLKNTR